jgi:hypothetical protein
VFVDESGGCPWLLQEATGPEKVLMPRPRKRLDLIIENGGNITEDGGTKLEHVSSILYKYKSDANHDART